MSNTFNCFKHTGRLSEFCGAEANNNALDIVSVMI